MNYRLPDAAVSSLDGMVDGPMRLDAAAIQAILDAGQLSRRRSFAKGDIIYSQGQICASVFWFVLSGHVELSMVAGDGHLLVVDLPGPNTLFGETGAFAGVPQPVTARAVEDCELLAFDANELLAHLSGYPELCKVLLQSIAARQHALLQRLKLMAHPKPEGRVGEMLHRMVQLHGREEPNGRILLDLPLTHEQIAGMTGLTRVTVTRTLKRLGLAGVIEIIRRRIYVLHPQRLLHVA